MVTLAVGHKLLPVANKQPAMQSWFDHMTKNALWYPVIPPRKLCFNQDAFLGGDPLIPGHRPIVWKLFGGGDGSRLSSLTEITFRGNDNYIPEISFMYACEDLPASHMNVGYRASGHVDTGWPVFFPIDGPGGERINGMEALVKECDGIKSRYFGRGEPLHYKVRWARLTQDWEC